MQTHRYEPGAQLAGYGPRQKGLSASGWPPQQEAPTEVGAVGSPKLGIAQRGQKRLLQTLLDVSKAAHVSQSHRL